MKGCPTCGQRFVGREEFCPKDGSTLVAMDLKIDDQLIGMTIDGRYTINSKIGEGGMGVVYLATHAVIGKKCALKVLRKELSSESEVGQRFTQEARAAAAIGNEHIIEINDFGQMSDGSSYFVMEYLEGLSLHEHLKKGPKIDPKRALHILSQCCDALASAHAEGIVHRDLKPENIVLIEKRNDRDFVKILDFGIAKMARETSRLTKTGVIFGTPQYMSPEQAAGTTIDERTDIYSLGIIMYELLCGHVPFEADTFMGVLTKHLYEEPIPPRRLIPPVDIPQAVEAVLLKAIAKKPDRRYQTMLEFGEDILALAQSRKPTIVYSQLRDTSASTIPPAPSEIVGRKIRTRDSFPDKSSAGKKFLYAGIGIASLVAIAIFVVTWLGSGKESEANARDIQLKPVQIEKEKKAEDTSPAIQDKQSDQQPKTDEVSAPSKEQSASIKLVSKPDAALLYQNGTLVGKLPLDLPRPNESAGGSNYVIKLEKYKDLEIVVTSATPSVFEVNLESLPDELTSPKTIPETPKYKTSKKEQDKQPDVQEKKSETLKSEEPPQETPKIRIEKKKDKDEIKGDLADPWAD